MKKKGKFKVKGSEILGSTLTPNTMGDLLDLPEKTDAQSSEESGAIASIPKTVFAQNRIASNPQSAPTPVDKDTGPEDLTRLHVHIRKDLADTLLDEVFRRKKDSTVPNKDATQRVVIEQALEAFFDRNQDSRNQEV